MSRRGRSKKGGRGGTDRPKRTAPASGERTAADDAGDDVRATPGAVPGADAQGAADSSSPAEAPVAADASETAGVPAAADAGDAAGAPPLRGREIEVETPIVQHPSGVHTHGRLVEDEPGAAPPPLSMAYHPRPTTGETAVLERPAPPEPAAPDVGPSAGEPVAPPGTVPAPDAGRRAYSLDALRGLFLILMTLGFTIQAGIFPDWMYHRQFPPPGEFVPIAGIAWRDLAYAAFIFTMAAALPVTLGRRIEKGDTELAIFFAALRRGLLLFVFALIIGHSNTFFIGYTQEGRALAVIGFIIMFMLFTRRRADWDEGRFRAMRIAGWIAAVVFLAVSPLVYDSMFSPARRDDIIAALAFVAVAGSVIWYLTRHNLLARLGVLAAVVALHLGAQTEGWIQTWWWSSPVPWLVRPSYLALLSVVIPGTIAGDLVVRWMREPATSAVEPAGWGRGRILLLALLAAAFTPIAVIGLYNRWVPETTQLTVALIIGGAFLVHAPRTSGERLLRQLFLWAGAWLLFGLLLDPAEGGIAKVPDTLSYFFTVSGLTMMLLVCLSALVDLLGRTGFARPMIEVGQNPMLCYVLFTVLLNSIFELIAPLRTVLRASPGEAILRSLLTVILVVIIVQAMTRRRVFWRT
jgi:predicted acyltransferase